jgi:hypothetical protein
MGKKQQNIYSKTVTHYELNSRYNIIPDKYRPREIKNPSLMFQSETINRMLRNSKAKSINNPKIRQFIESNLKNPQYKNIT